MTIQVHQNDLPDKLALGPIVAIDTETMGLDPHRDRLCLAQLSCDDGIIHLVRFSPTEINAPNIASILSDPKVLKLFHFGRFDIAVMRQYIGVTAQSVYCTKIASKLARTYTDRHGLKDLCRELLGIDISKEQQSSDWGAAQLSDKQIEYAAADVLHLHALKQKLDEILVREGRNELAQACFDYLPFRAELDLAGWPQVDMFAH
ncbi:MAG: ribonuclease H-like domain-containing protein [Pseudomonadota bacterium]|nr:ribonuclease H-like domain-containing protein [Pseudomonadota bacterium]